MTIYASDGSTLTEPVVDDVTPPAAPIEPDDSNVVDAEIDADLTDEQPPTEHVYNDDGEPVHNAEVVQVETDDEKPWEHETNWPHDKLVYHGDTLAIRVPQQNALTALYQATETCSEEFAMRMATKFVKHHLSEKSRERVIERMSDPDDPEYSEIDGVWSDLLRRIGDIGGKRVLESAKALAAVKAGKGR